MAATGVPGTGGATLSSVWRKEDQEGEASLGRQEGDGVSPRGPSLSEEEHNDSLWRGGSRGRTLDRKRVLKLCQSNGEACQRLQNEGLRTASY